MINTQEEYEASVRTVHALENLMVAAHLSGRLPGRKSLYLKLLILQTDIHKWEAKDGHLSET